MKSINLLVVIFILFSCYSFGQRADVEQLKNEVKEAKDALRNQLGDLRYDGSKVTYYEVKRDPSFKDLEVILFLRENYTLMFNGAPSSSKVAMRIYDKPSHQSDRVMLYEVKNISGKSRTVTEQELNNQLTFYVQNPQKLRSVYVEYEVSKGKNPDRGAVVLVLGYDK